jgi:serine/threonine protein kinase
VDGGVPGPDFGPYRLVELLASSARASVHRAVDRRHDDRIVALKIFAPALSADPAFRARFRLDAAALSALREPHVVSVHTYGELAGYDVPSGSRLNAVLTGHQAQITQLGIVRSGQRPLLISAAADNTIRVWDLAVHAHG